MTQSRSSNEPDSPTLLIGTAESVSQLAQVLRVAEPDAPIAGAVVTESLPPGQLHAGTDEPRRDGTAMTGETPVPPPFALTGIEVLGHIDDLESIIAETQAGRALIALPMTQVELTRAISGRLDELDISWRFMPTLADQLAGRVDLAEFSDAPANASPSRNGKNKTDNTTPRITNPDGADSEPLPSLADGAASQYRRLHVTARGIDPRHLDAATLLDRQPAPLDEAAIRAAIAGQTVLITGAGGSIGSELARVAARFDPARLILVERAENALFEIDQEIDRLFPDLHRIAVLHDVTDAPRTKALIAAHAPQVIFHAAAHKHVPMMEDHPAEAVENNFYGTRSIADAALAAGGKGKPSPVKRFVMISTDKAVNPTSVMGASKRLAELYVQSLNGQSLTKKGGASFCMVRFGNVLGSACSVLPIWAKQIAADQPITVTHPDMMRYFMTIPEAAGLVLQSAALAGDTAGGMTCGGTGVSPVDTRKTTTIAGAPILTTGETPVPPSFDLRSSVFLLDMGEPIRIVDLARRFIRAQGFEPDADVPIVFTGIRPGEKLYEELAYSGEEMLPTSHPAVRLWRTAAPSSQRIREIVTRFDALRRAPSDGHAWQNASPDQIIAALRDAVPEFRRVDDAPMPVAAAG